MLSVSVIMGLIPMLCWGIADFLQSIVIRRLGEVKTVFFSNSISLFLVLPIVFFIDLGIEMGNLVLLFIGGVFQAIAVYNFYKSMNLGDISIVTPISASYPIVTVTFLVFFLSKQLSALSVFAIILLMLGIALASTDLKKIKHIHTVKGIKESIIALLGWGTFFFILEIVSNNTTIFNMNFPATNYVVLFFYSWLFIAAPLIIFGLVKKGIPTKKEIMNKSNLSILLITNIIYIISWIAINYGFTVGNAAIITPISSLYPSITIILALIFYKEKIVLNQKIGILTILTGLVLISL